MSCVRIFAGYDLSKLRFEVEDAMKLFNILNASLAVSKDDGGNDYFYLTVVYQ